MVDLWHLMTKCLICRDFQKNRWQFRSLGEDFGTNCKRVTKKKDLKKHTWVSHKKGGVEEAHACASQTTRTFKTGEIRRFRRRCVNLKRFSFISSYLESWHAENKFENIDIKTDINEIRYCQLLFDQCVVLRCSSPCFGSSVSPAFPLAIG